MVYEACPDDYAGGPSDLTLLVDMWHAGYGLMPIFEENIG